MLQTALDVIAAEGLDGLSVRRIARQLKISPATVYGQFATKDELLELALDEVLGKVEIPRPDPADWPAQVSQVARTTYQELLVYGDLAGAWLGQVPVGPNVLRVAEGLMAIMVNGGVPIELAAWAKDRLLVGIHADAYQTSRLRARELGSATGFADQVRRYYAQLPPEEFPHLTHPAAVPAIAAGDDRFETSLRLLLDGLTLRSVTTLRQS